MQAAAPRYSMQRTAYSGYSSVASSSSSYRPVLHVCHHCTPQAARCRATPRTPPGDSSSPTIGSKSSNQKPAGQQELPPELATFAASIQGRTFHCTMCGKCCTMEGPTHVSEDDAARISKHLGMSRDTFYRLYTKRDNTIPGWRLLKDREPLEAGDAPRCVFLEVDNTCAIQAVKPLQCSTYPWWPELMNDEDWELEKDLICEGFDHPDAQPTDLAHAARQMQSYAAHDRMLELATPEPTSSSSSIDDEEEEDKEEEPESALLLETYGAIESVKVSDALRRSFGRWEDMMYAMAAQRHRNDLLGGSDSDSDDDT